VSACSRSMTWPARSYEFAYMPELTAQAACARSDKRSVMVRECPGDWLGSTWVDSIIGSRPLTRSSHLSLLSSTRMPMAAAVTALVSEPTGKMVSSVTGNLPGP